MAILMLTGCAPDELSFEHEEALLGDNERALSLDDSGTAEDAGEPDAGEEDAGDPDAGDEDGGSPDAGEPDAGEPGPSGPTPDYCFGNWETFYYSNILYTIPVGRARCNCGYFAQFGETTSWSISTNLGSCLK
ncbi:hypothetical protein HUA74_15275 [Myxococcus sp. CA051A]|uniref:hypothetical protein n=1 Tax=unclassified Myxococcus TaxID=2648731 RepID=UPI00157A699E|nr:MULTISPECIES: hypothetical protein [unclassified Myxococcus]NTX35573.1 hypothetical protein [Myxococcus sp. CA033]NTX62022.1 hypothetical protein [Myxococcus sp. CA051A]